MISVAFSLRYFITFFGIIKRWVACIMIAWWWCWWLWRSIHWKISCWTCIPNDFLFYYFLFLNANWKAKTRKCGVLTNTTTSNWATWTIMIIWCTISASILWSILIIFWGTISWIIVFRSRTIQRTTLWINTSVSTLRQKKKEKNSLKYYKQKNSHLFKHIHIDPLQHN